MDNPARVLIASPIPPPYGGIGYGTQKLIINLKESSSVEIALLDTSPRWRRIYDTSVILRFIGGGLFGIKQVLALVRMMRRFQPNVLHIRSSASLSCLRDYIFIRIARRNAVRTIYGLHFGRIPDIVKRKSWEWYWLKRAICNAWRTVVLDQESFRVLAGEILSKKILRIPNYIETTTLAKHKCDDKSPMRVIFLGWVIPTKGIMELVEAWNAIGDRQWQLLFVGPGKKSYIVHLKKSVAPGLSAQFFGELNHETAIDVLRHCEILVLPSYTEGFPHVILEAMSLGIPVIGTNVGAVPEMLMARDGLGPCGLLIEPRNSMSLAQALQKLMHNQDLRVELGMNGQTRIQREYSSSLILSKWIKLFDQAAMGNSE